jgi:hypothetical protein
VNDSGDIMENNTFWQLFFGNNPLTKGEFIKAYLLWWVIALIVLFVLSLFVNPKVMSMAFCLGFCQIFWRYLPVAKWSKYLAIPAFFPPISIILFIILAIKP